MTLASHKRLQPLEPGWMRYLNGRLPGETPHPADDFFNDGDHSAWTLTQVTGTTTPTEKDGVLSLRDVGTAARDLNVMSKSMGGLSAPVTIETAVSMIGPAGGGGEGTVALGMTDGTTAGSNWAGMTLFTSLTGAYFTAGTLTLFDSAATSYYSQGNWMQVYLFYLRFCWKATDTFRVAFSPTGVSWIDLPLADIARTFAPTRFALGVSAYGGLRVTAGFQYFRAANADLITGI